MIPRFGCFAASKQAAKFASMDITAITFTNIAAALLIDALILWT
ncbi:hypothetical protein [Peptoanaerobacter stomatis]|nr:hypothetical protein [Peptoanaerobacter stomatis]